MSDLIEPEPTTQLVVKPDNSVQLQNFERQLLSFLDERGLPTTSIFVSVNERMTAFKNIEDVIAKLSDEQRQRSIYISKFVAAVASGLFDAALNYMWDETITELRRRVAQYDISYFCDNAKISAEKRKNIKDVDDLSKIDDSELVYGSKEIGLISELGFKHLDYIRFMRNWASAAHPNQNELSGLQLVAWLETCIKEVISLPLSNAAVEIKKLLSNIKSNSVSEAEAKEIAPFFVNLSQDQINNLASGFFGIYTRSDSTPITKQNIRLLLPFLWDRVDEDTRQQFGIKYGRFVANNDQEEKGFARQFLEVVSALSYIPNDLRGVEVEAAVTNLLNVHRAFNNFYNEPPFARELQRLVGEVGNVPKQASNNYVMGLVEVFLTNGNGTAWNAEPIYTQLMSQFNEEQALKAVLSFNNLTISSRLQFQSCQEKFRELLKLMNTKVSSAAVKELIVAVTTYAGPLDKMKDDSRIKRRVDNLNKILS